MAKTLMNLHTMDSLAAAMRRLLVTLILALFLLCCADVSAKEQDVSFYHNNTLLFAKHIVPEQWSNNKKVIIFVHGDGAANADVDGYYRVIWQRILAQGIAVFSWDKSGVGQSQGDWLAQSMSDRQHEVLSAIQYLKKEYGYLAGDIGLFGFSQAGWVVPDIANKSADIGFVIGIGFALNWVEQGWYLTLRKLKDEQASIEEVRLAYQAYQNEVALIRSDIGYQAYLMSLEKGKQAMTKRRFHFVKRNIESDAKAAFGQLNKPTLLFYGDKDLHVDPHANAEQIKKLTKGKSSIQVHILKDASHALLNATEFNEREPGIAFWLKLMWQGEEAYSQHFFELLDAWLKKL